VKRHPGGLLGSRFLLVLVGYLAATSAATAQPVAPEDVARQVHACPDSPIPILVERSLAEDLGLAPDDVVRLSGAGGTGCEASVEGVFEPPADPAVLTRERPRVLLHLPDLGLLSGRVDEVDRFSVIVRAGADTADLRRRLASLMPGGQVLPSRVVAEQSSTAFNVVSRFHRAIALITLTAGGVFLACIMTLKIQERRVHVSALRLAGISRGTLARWVLLESALISGIGGLMGLGLGVIASSLINAFYRRAYETTLYFSLVTRDTLVISLALAIVLGFMAGAVATWRLLQADALVEVGR
jgi:predicted lysophospholipase L1 biosynthesis ABC-type transport system permease subunit